MSDNKPTIVSAAAQSQQARPERYEDVVGPARRGWHEALIKLTTVTDAAHRAVDRQNERLDQIDQRLTKGKSYG